MDAVLGLWHQNLACEGGVRHSIAVGKIIWALRRRESGAAAGSELICAFIQFGVWLSRLLLVMIQAQGRDGSRRELDCAWQGAVVGMTCASVGLCWALSSCDRRHPHPPCASTWAW